MPEYKAPSTRGAVKSKVKAILTAWLDEQFGGPDDDIQTVWDDADDAGCRAYDNEILKGHTVAMNEAKLRFWEELRAKLGSQIEGVFEELGENAS